MAQNKDEQARRDEFEVAYYTKELGRPLQRRLLQRRLDEIRERPVVSDRDALAGDEEAGRDRHDPPARERRSG